MGLPHTLPHAKHVGEPPEHAPAAVIQIVDTHVVRVAPEIREHGIGISHDHYLHPRPVSESVPDVRTTTPAALHRVEQTVVGGIAVEPSDALEEAERQQAASAHTGRL